MIAPYSTEHLNLIYNQLFCDDIAAFTVNDQPPSEYPLSVLLSDGLPEKEKLQQIADDAAADSRIRLMAYRRLAAWGVALSDKTLLGVIIEVGMDGGTDTLAAYKDGSARYINHSEKLIIWDSPTAESNTIIANLMQVSEQVVAQIGLWTEPRLPAPGDGEIRLNFLTADGLYFGQGPFTVLQSDAMGGPVIHAAISLLQFLTTAAA